MRDWVRAILGGRPYIYGALAGAAMFAVVYVITAVFAHYHLRPEATFIDDFFIGFLVAALIVSLERQHQREIRRQQERVSLILEMNHHIRNALQTIVYVNAQASGKDAEMIQQAIKRIEWALTEILPGEPLSFPTFPGVPNATDSEPRRSAPKPPSAS